MATETNQQALNVLRGETCEACGKAKKSMRSFCGGCYARLQRHDATMARALYKKLFAGYLEAYLAALQWLQGKSS